VFPLVKFNVILPATAAAFDNLP